MVIVAAILFISICAATHSTHGLRIARVSVCGSNGKKYISHCEFALKTCKPNDTRYDKIVSVPMKYCGMSRYNKKPKGMKASLCGIDGVTYQSCEILKQKCTKNRQAAVIISLHPGVCGNCSKENVCVWGKMNAVIEKARRRKICAGEQEYKDKCTFSIARCLQYKREKSILKMTKCPIQAPQRFGKPIRIKKGSICGSDRRKYANFCTFMYQTCKPGNRSHDKVFPVEMKYCEDESLKVPEGMKASLCGKDGITYQACQLGLQICNRKNSLIAPLHLGKCGICTIENVCSWEKMEAIIAVQDGNKKMCAGGVTYTTKCAFSIACCKQYKKDNSILKVEKCGKYV